MSFEQNIKVEDAFNLTLDPAIWVKHEGKTAQGKLGDFYNTLLGINVDFKVDCYNNNNNIVLEVTQASGTNCIDELDPNSFVAYVKINTGAIFCWRVSQLRDFRQSMIYKQRVGIKAWSNTEFKNFRLSELPKPAFINKCDNSQLTKYLKNDTYGNDKYKNIFEV